MTSISAEKVCILGHFGLGILVLWIAQRQTLPLVVCRGEAGGQEGLWLADYTDWYNLFHGRLPLWTVAFVIILYELTKCAFIYLIMLI